MAKGEKSSVSASTAKSSNSTYETIKVIVHALLLALVFRTFFYQPFTIPTGSMRPTLLEGDHIFVSKYSYGFSKYSFPLSLNLFEGRIWGGLPERGDVIVFRQPRNPDIDYIKRLVGLPGDTVQVLDGHLLINGKSVDVQSKEPYFGPEDKDKKFPIEQFIETFPEGHEHLILDMGDTGYSDNTKIFTVPEKHFFFMGDNRDNSTDSRFERDLGFVPYENLIGKAQIIFFSAENETPLWMVWRWPFDGRLDRAFKIIN